MDYNAAEFARALRIDLENGYEVAGIGLTGGRSFRVELGTFFIEDYVYWKEKHSTADHFLAPLNKITWVALVRKP